MTPAIVRGVRRRPAGSAVVEHRVAEELNGLPLHFCTSMEPGPTKLAGPCTLFETSPPPVPWLATSPVDLNVAPLIATLFPSNFTPCEKPSGELLLFAMLGSGVGMNGAGGPGILHTLEPSPLRCHLSQSQVPCHLVFRHRDSDTHG